MNHVKSALQYATDSNALEFKKSILAALQDKVQDALHLKKMEIGAHVFAEKEDDTSKQDYTDNEENIDENL
ncbi:hypothetical protein EBS02_00105 [bacterium]|nr:hypothetical protein [bacterium]